MAKSEKLSEYHQKRSFDKTPEPRGEQPPADTGNRFVIQEHHARRLHWDLRLEHNGVLVSWALPRGLPDDPKHNRLAVHTEDHPLEYLTFEGDIPAGEYGGGNMTVWDHGTYEAEKFRDDEVIMRLHGEGGRARGKYALFKTSKERDGKDWLIHRMDPPEPGGDPMPDAVEPMKATPSELPPDDDAWGYEIKWDGIRAVAYGEPGKLRLVNRNGRDVTRQYPEIGPLMRQIGAHRVVLDGELVAFDGNRPSFEKLQPRLQLTDDAVIRQRRRDIPVTYIIFDLLYLDGRSLVRLGYAERRRELEALGLDGPSWQVPAYHPGEGAVLLEASRAQNLEGVIAKRLRSTYQPGRRSHDWLKIKNVHRQEVVIGGWTAGKGQREKDLGALLTGYYDDDGATLRYAGKVGTGFDAKTLRMLRERLDPLERADSPFVGRQPEIRHTVFVEPELVCEVDFAEWTDSGTMRHPTYRGLRDDKPPTEVVRELPEPPPAEPDDLAGDDDRVPTDAHDADADAGDPNGPDGAPERASEPDDASAHTSEPDDASADVGGPDNAPGGSVATHDELTDGLVSVENRRLKLSNLDKVLYPATGTTKRQIIEYYVALAPALLPHLSGRPLTMKRYPNGVDAQHFYEKQAPQGHPSWITTAPIWSDSNNRTVDYVVIDSLATLVWAANLADLEMHTMLARADDVECPTMIVFDLDPGEGAGLAECSRVAVWIRELLGHIGLDALVKSSGSKGLHLAVPLNTPTSYEQTKPFAHAVAQLVESEHPDDVVSTMTKARRHRKVFVDWSQNTRHKTTVAPFSLRARERPTVSAPLSWDEVHAVADGDIDPESLRMDAQHVIEQLDERAALFRPLLEHQQDLPNLGANT